MARKQRLTLFSGGRKDTQKFGLRGLLVAFVRYGRPRVIEEFACRSP